MKVGPFVEESHGIVADKIIERYLKDGVVSMRSAARESGYHPDQSHKIAKADTFQRAMFRKVPLDVLALAQERQLGAIHIKQVTLDGIEDEQDAIDTFEPQGWTILRTFQHTDGKLHAWVATPNYEQRDKALDKIYKLMGYYAAEKMEISTPIDDLTDEELASELIEEGQIVSSTHVEAKK